jgi:hypothetical protein
VIGCALALDLDQNREISGGLAVPRIERLEELETVRLGVNSNLDDGAVLGRGLECVLTGIVTAWGKLVATGVLELEELAIAANKIIGDGVKGQAASERESGDDIGRCDESMGGGVGIVTASEVTVVRGEDYESD